MILVEAGGQGSSQAELEILRTQVQGSLQYSLVWLEGVLAAATYTEEVNDIEAEPD